MKTEDKVIASLEHMTENAGLATDLTLRGDEIYFRFGGHVFSIIRFYDNTDYGDFGFFIYPGFKGTIENLIESFELGFSDEIDFVTFHSGKMDDPKATKIMERMYAALKSRALGVDVILDDVLRVEANSI